MVSLGKNVENRKSTQASGEPANSPKNPASSCYESILLNHPFEIVWPHSSGKLGAEPSRHSRWNISNTAIRLLPNLPSLHAAIKNISVQELTAQAWFISTHVHIWIGSLPKTIATVPPHPGGQTPPSLLRGVCCQDCSDDFLELGCPHLCLISTTIKTQHPRINEKGIFGLSSRTPLTKTLYNHGTSVFLHIH